MEFDDAPMLFKRFLSLRPRSGGLPADQDALLAVVREDQDTARRLAACRRIIRLADLAALAETDPDAGVREIALARYQRLLCGAEGPAPSLTDRLAEIGKIDNQRVLEHLAAEAGEPEIRLAAITRLTNPLALASCALGDAVTANRGAAAERLEDKASLERVSRQIGRKDKNVYRIVRRKLKEIAEREALPARMRVQCEELCQRLERLGRFENWVQDRAHLDLLDRQWSEIGSQADEEWRTRYGAARESFLAAYSAYRQAHEARVAEDEARDANRAARAGLIEETGQCTAISDEKLLAERMADIQARWAALVPLDEAPPGTLERDFASAWEASAARLENLRARRASAARLAELTADIQGILDQSRPVERSRADGLLERARPALALAGLDDSVVAGFETARAKLEARLGKQIRHAEQRLQAAEGKLSALEEALESGELKRAEPLFQSLQATLDLAVSSGLGRRSIARVKEELRRLAPRVKDLQKWRKFGADTHREGLCQTMEALETDDMPMEAKAVRLGDLQQEWKDLDRGGAPANQKLWRRFHAASEQVYEHCRPYFEEQAKQRRAARAQREDVCRQLEGFLEHVDWDRVDWKQAVRAEREMRRGWAALGEVEGRHQRGLERRFHAAIKRLHERLAAERSHNQAFKSDLIERVEALVESPELDDAIEETKRLQRMWRTTVPARQRDENRLWQRFRTACDAVFARRRQQHEAFAAELDEHLGQREALCAEAEALAASDGDPAALSQAFHRIEERWGETESLPVPNRAAAALNQRWREARRGVLRKERELAAQARRAALSLLARQATVCESLERALESGSLTGDRVAAAQAAWRELPRQTDADLQRRMESRFRAAVAALGSDGDALRTALPDNATRRAELCLHLEILAQVDSPPETNQARLAFQVDRLKGHMRAGEKDPLGDASRLLEDWYLCGPAPAAVAPGLERRFQRALSALEQGEGEIGLHDA